MLTKMWLNLKIALVMLHHVIRVLHNCLVPNKFCWAHVLACENSRHFATSPLVCPRNDAEKRAQKFHADDVSL